MSALAPATTADPLPARLTPVSPTDRIHAIDAARGLALLGILLVNVQLFADTFGSYMRLEPEEGVLNAAAFYFVKIFCEGKFYPLFSLLFGIGLTLQAQRAHRAGRPFLGVGLRRLAVLGTLGLIHGLLLWYGDILFLYACVGVLLLLMTRARPRPLIITASSLLVVAVLLTSLLGWMASSASPPPEPPAEAPAAVSAEAPAQPGLPPFQRLMQAMEREDPSLQQGPAAPIWVQSEREAYQRGPWTQVMGFRALSWAFMIYIYVFGIGWQVAAMFLFGSALVKLDFFAPHRRPWHLLLLKLGALIGLPLSITAAVLPLFLGENAMVMMMPLVIVGGPLLSLAYLGGMTLLVQSGRMPLLTGLLANTGRMALTNYLTQTVVATALFYYWGLGLFGQVNEANRFAIALSIYAAQVPLSTLWLARFRFGPMEWLWRSLTYLRPQPMLKATPIEIPSSRTSEID